MRTYRVCFIDVPSIEGLRFGGRRPRLGPMKGTCFYVADPMCSWCWAFAPIIDEVAGALPAEVELRYVLGGLAPDSDVPMPEEMQKKLQATWRTIAARTGTEFNFDFWKACKPRRSTYPACRAVLAAKTQETAKTSAMFRAIQRAYYQEARNPSDTETLTELASEIDLDVDRSGVLPDHQALSAADAHRGQPHVSKLLQPLLGNALRLIKRPDGR